MKTKIKKLRKDLHAFDRAILTWKAPEFTHYEKSMLWFIVAALVLILLVIYGIESDGWTFSIAIVVFAGVYYLMHRRIPANVDVKISKIGIKIGRHIFPYSHLKNFWIVYNPPFLKRLYLRMSSKFKPDVFVSLEDMDPAEARKVLLSYLPELTGMHEPLSDTLIRIFKL